MPEPSADSERMPDLADLIQRRRDAGDSYRDIARHTGGAVDHPTVERWHKRTTDQFPRNAKVFSGFARALDENVEQIVLSMALQLGVPIPRYDTTAGILPAGAERMTYEQRRALRALVRAIVEVLPDSLPAKGDVDLAAHLPGDGEERRPRKTGRKDDEP